MKKSIWVKIKNFRCYEKRTIRRKLNREKIYFNRVWFILRKKYFYWYLIKNIKKIPIKSIFIKFKL